MTETKQVARSHYEFQKYMAKPRWISVWHQLDELVQLKPKRVLEIGPGPGLLKSAAGLFGIAVETLDLDPDLEPDHVGSVSALPFPDNSFDVVCAFQVLEHLPYDRALQAFREMSRVSRGNLLISLPDAQLVRRYLLYVPKIGNVDWLIRHPFARAKKHHFDGQHHWEINKRDYPLKKVLSDLSDTDHTVRTYRVKEIPYHRFFVVSRK